MSREFESFYVSTNEDEVRVKVTYDWNPGYPGHALTGPADGASPPEPREVEEVTSVIRLDTGEEVISLLTQEQKDMFLVEASENMRVQDEYEADCMEGALEDKYDAMKEDR